MAPAPIPLFPQIRRQPIRAAIKIVEADDSLGALDRGVVAEPVALLLEEVVEPITGGPTDGVVAMDAK